MSRFSIIALILLLPFSAEARRTQAGPLWEQANEFYAQAMYDSAAFLYEDLLEEGFAGFDLEYNLGNAYFKLGELGQAILHYERAQEYDSRNKDLVHNLELAYLRQPDREITPLPENVFQRIWKSMVGVFSASKWGFLTIAFFWLGVLGMGLFWFSVDLSYRKLGWFAAITAFVIGALSLLLGWGQHNLELSDRHAIIMEPSAVIKSAPSESATNLYILREGFKLRITDETTSWTEVTLADGNVGWIPSEVLEEI